MLQVVKHTHEKHDVEAPDPIRSQIVHVHLAIVDARSEDRVHLVKARIVPIIDRHHLGPAALHFKTEPSIPSANIEDALASQIPRDWKLSDTALLPFQLV